jgi:NADH-quinone oxidoreductase subunit N
VLACGLGSLAGIPPFAGFLGKLFVFVAAFKAGHYGLLGVAIAGVVISIYYYFGWIRTAYFSDEIPVAPQAPRDPSAGSDKLLRTALFALAAASVVLGFYQGPLGRIVSGH